ncbi:RsmB/NOP family class I SAM-dependent RNA methyltransferase [Meridianimarinicoccus aquatilis]|uniref:RsmB/NOP family class I SAM-dependent RNA methyltransferase n=1 Tax=Meridianimarinicoccus aquatilis TaxID=2552766 RepID=UPI0014053A56
MGARAAALRLLLTAWEEGEMLSAAVDAPDGPLERLEPSERARAQRLALATLRGADAADALLKPFLRKAPPPRIQAILRLATVELAQGGAAHGVVDGAVSLARQDRKSSHLSGLVNAVLRKVAETAVDRWPDMPAQRLPGWLRGRLQSAWGSKTTVAIEAVQAAVPPLDLTPRGQQAADAAGLADAAGGEVLPTGSVRLSASAQVSALPGYEDGAFWVQDAAAALPAKVLSARPGERVLDMCAAPGGKTMQLAAAGAHVTALDISAPRLARLHENLARAELEATVVTADALHYAGIDGGFDAILLDAPCSATGTIRRHPDLPFVKTSADIKPLVQLQAAMLDHALTLLKPGGRLVFCTCSLLPDEGEAQAEAALARHSSLVVDRTALDVPGIDPDWLGQNGLRVRPDHWADRGGMDGFFIAAFRQIAPDAP